jgi:hypothetical protein
LTTLRKTSILLGFTNLNRSLFTTTTTFLRINRLLERTLALYYREEERETELKKARHKRRRKQALKLQIGHPIHASELLRNDHANETTYSVRSFRDSTHGQ